MRLMLRSFQFWAITFIGSVLVVQVAVRFWRGTSDLNRLTLTSMGIGIALVWFAYIQHAQSLNQLGGQLEEKALARVSRTGDTMTLFGHMIALGALNLLHRY